MQHRWSANRSSRDEVNYLPLHTWIQPRVQTTPVILAMQTCSWEKRSSLTVHSISWVSETTFQCRGQLSPIVRPSFSIDKWAHRFLKENSFMASTEDGRWNCTDSISREGHKKYIQRKTLCYWAMKTFLISYHQLSRCWLLWPTILRRYSNKNYIKSRLFWALRIPQNDT